MVGLFHENAILTMEALHQEPTKAGWEAAILHALRGDLDFQIEQIGDVSDFFQPNLRTNPNPVLAELEFHRALEAVVSRWELGSPHTFAYVDGMLRLIRKFHPPSGPRKIIGRLNSAFSYFCVPAVSDEQQRHLSDISLMALAGYFTAPVSQSDEVLVAEYKSYLGVLRGITSSIGINQQYFWGHACKRLIELRDWDITDPATVEYLSGHYREILRELLSWLLSSEWGDRAKLLSILYHFSNLDFEDARGSSAPSPYSDLRSKDSRSEDFIRTLEIFGGRLDERRKPPIIFDASGSPLVLLFDDKSDHAYVESLAKRKLPNPITLFLRDFDAKPKISGPGAQAVATKEAGQ